MIWHDLAFFPAISFPAAAPKQGRHWVKLWTPCAQLVETEEGRFVETEAWRNGNHPHVVAPAKWCMRLGRVSLSVSSSCPEGAPYFFSESPSKVKIPSRPACCGPPETKSTPFSRLSAVAPCNNAAKSGGGGPSSAKACRTRPLESMVCFIKVSFDLSITLPPVSGDGATC